MSSPARRSSSVHLPKLGPSSSVLKQLLQEIQGLEYTSKTWNASHTPIDGLGHPSTDGPCSRKGSLGCNSRPQHRGSSVWVGGGSVTEDARQKLRALDEARQRRQSASGSRFGSLTAFPSAPNAPKALPIPHSPPMFTNVQCGRAATISEGPPPSPLSEHPESYSHLKRERGGSDSPELISKKLRHSSYSDMTSLNRGYLTASTPTDKIMRGGGPIATTQVGSSSVQAYHMDSLPRAYPSPQPGLRVAPIHAYKPPQPPTPRRPLSTEDVTESPDETPAWMQPLQLVDDAICIYKNIHGNASRDHPLCLYCFRQHGEFHRILKHSCETCGRDDVLEGHYWS